MVELLPAARSILMSLSFGSSKFSKTKVLEPSLAPSTAHAPSPSHQGMPSICISISCTIGVFDIVIRLPFLSGPSGSLSPRYSHRRRHRHHARPRAVAPAPSKDPGNFLAFCSC